MAKDGEVRMCECGMPDRFAIDPAYPVKFDGEMNEYNVVGDGRIARMYYCFSCGGRLPESKPSKYFTVPDEADQAEVRTIIAGIKSIDDLRRTLGEPDDTFDGAAFPCVEWKRTYRYSTRWKSLFLDAQEMPDATIRIVYGGRFIGGQVDRGLKAALRSFLHTRSWWTLSVCAAFLIVSLTAWVGAFIFHNVFCFLMMFVVAVFGTGLGLYQIVRNAKWQRTVGVVGAMGVGIALGAIARLAAIPADPTGHIVSPIAGGIVGLILALFVLVLLDNDPWRPRHNQ
jgi:hypothetical protein